MTTAAAMGVDHRLYRQGEWVASLWPRPEMQADPPRCYVDRADTEKIFLAMYRDSYRKLRPHEPVPEWALAQWRDPQKRN